MVCRHKHKRLLRSQIFEGEHQIHLKTRDGIIAAPLFFQWKLIFGADLIAGAANTVFLGHPRREHGSRLQLHWGRLSHPLVIFWRSKRASLLSLKGQEAARKLVLRVDKLEIRY